MSDLTSHLQGLAIDEALGHLTLALTREHGWMASHKAPGAAGYRCEHDADPARAILKALGVNLDDRYVPPAPPTSAKVFEPADTSGEELI